jgi:CNT family concentrative nucleoside transporter
MFYNFISFAGIFVLIGLGWLFSRQRANMNWRAIGFGVALQLVIGVIVFRIRAGTQVFLWINDGAVSVLETAAEGAKFVFGPLAIPAGQDKSLGFILAFQAFPTIIFFSALIAILYYYGVMSALIRGFAYVFTRLMRISGAESLVTASNIFVGVEANLTVRPYLARMTPSEFCTALTAGMATVSSNVLALYVFSLKDQFPTIAGHLISASLMSAPAAIVMSKVLCPEDGQPDTLGIHVQPFYERENNLFEAIINGANSGVRMIVGITALLIAVLGLVALADLLLGSIGVRLNPLVGLQGTWSLRALCGYAFYPLTVILGIPLQDVATASRIIGERLIVTEVTAYSDLASALARGQFHVPDRSAVITTYALCGFAHLASMAIFVGGVCALAPGRTRDVAKVAVWALAAATLACLMTACVAGTFYTEGSVLFGR